MDKYTPNELQDIQNMKKRVMNNVNAHVRNHHVKQRSFNWRFTTLTAIFTLCIVGYIGYELVYKGDLSDTNHVVIDEPEENNTGAIHEAPFDYTRPEITVGDDKFYIEGVTLGDSFEKVTSIFGHNFTIHVMEEEGVWFGTRIDYDTVVSFHFLKESLIEMTLYVVDEQYIKEIYEEYEGLKEKTDYQHFLYAAGNQAIKAEKADEAFYVYFLRPTPPDKPDGDVSSPEDVAPSPIDFTRPKISVINNKFNIEGVTLWDSLEKVTSILGTNYIENNNPETTSGADLEIIYDNRASFIFYQNKLIQVMLLDVSKEYYKNIFNASQQIKFEPDNNTTFLYIKESDELIKSQVANNKHYVYLRLADPNFHYNYGEYIQ